MKKAFRFAISAALLATACLLMAFTAQGQTYGVVYKLVGGNRGANPYAGVTVDGKGKLYGSAYTGGENGEPSCRTDGCGVIYGLDNTGKEGVLYRFTNQTSGAHSSSVILDAAGNLYGTTDAGGGNNGGGRGTAYMLSPSGILTLLHEFVGGTSDGAQPAAGLVRDSSGNLYGTTDEGGGKGCGGLGCGTVFKLNSTGAETLLYSFTGGTDGGAGIGEVSGLVRDAQGNLYGETTFGGNLSCNSGDGCGVVFKVDTAGNETVIHSFAGGPTDGNEPSGGLFLDANANLYGVAGLGGDVSCDAPYGCGTVFRIDAG